MMCNKGVEGHQKWILPVVFEGAKEFLESSHFLDGIKEFDVTNDMPEMIPDLLW